MRLRGLALGFALVLAISGCGARAWKQALKIDEPAAYHRFLREHGQSRYAADARRRLEVARLRDDPSYENFLAFQQRYPGDALVAEVQTLVEAAGFEAARAIGSGAAYRAFLANFPDSDQARRALSAEASGLGPQFMSATAAKRIHGMSSRSRATGGRPRGPLCTYFRFTLRRRAERFVTGYVASHCARGAHLEASR